MANIYRVLGQINPTANTATTLYTVPSATSTVASTLTVCNLGATTTFRIAIQPAGATLSNSQYISYNTIVNSNDTVFLTVGLSLATTDVVTCYANTSNVTFSLFGTEIS